jgi:hypothetical protein
MRILVSSFIVASSIGLQASGQSVRRAKAPIDVGPVVQVSKAYASVPHYESLAAADPDHPGRMITCSMVYPSTGERSYLMHQYCYVTFDGGKTWEGTLKSEILWGNGDPAPIYGRGDTVFVATLIQEFSKKPGPLTGDDDPSLDYTLIYRSTDGGRTWKESTRFPLIDREHLAVDRTSGKFAGRIYFIGQGGVPGITGTYGPSALEVRRSIDGGVNFLGPVYAAYPQGAVIMGVGTSAVLSDGTYIANFGMIKPGRDQNLERGPRVTPNAEIHVVRSTTGGETLVTHKVADVRLDRGRTEGGIIGQLAADPGSAAFKDRVYVVYPAIVDDRYQVQLSYSADKGKTWSRPVVVNDDRSPADGSKGPDHVLPAVGVNKDGVVLVAWYDRREAKDNLGWHLRASASLDGGETFSQSVPVTNVINSYSGSTPWSVTATGYHNDRDSQVDINVSLGSFFTVGGHTTGMAVDADGTFHPTWHSNNGNSAMQLWTAPIKVNGIGAKSGSIELAGMQDISKLLEMVVSRPELDPRSGTMKLTAQLRNTSNDTIEGPVKVRVLTLESALGVPEITNADNGEHGTGAIWDFSKTIGSLAPMQVGSPKTLTFKVRDIRQIESGYALKSRVLNIGTRVYGKAHKGKPSADDSK